MKITKTTCDKCDKQIRNSNLKRHVLACRGQSRKNEARLSTEERKNIPSSCPLCNKQFENVYRMSAHKGHCSGANSVTHLEHYRSWNKGKLLESSTKKILRDPSSVLVEDSIQSTGYIKKVLLAFNLKEYKCECCEITSWNGKDLILELDHINGNNRDHRIENIRFLCPNCHSQTGNFRGRNNGKQTYVTDETLEEALRTTPNIRKALMKVGLTPKGGNYLRCHELLLKMKNNKE